ncbi:hypothetical protein [Terrihabitans rhizophilus]|uniref:Uncharacterized protein n=1 Tax=Terrihabitans rhizophilus TaxID=3092662 RepID=A0ABU4RLY8_9HYPH|nr:hypothetical protein [Terrihabitans sp. PJ23]MDX6805836.1 hypothetical protein [Terrihabitans sp. PJ23]
MKMTAAALVLALTTGGALAQGSSGPGLRGEFRNAFVGAGIAACQKLKDEPHAALLPPDLIDQSCTCIANKVADRMAMSEAQSLMLLLIGGAMPEGAELERLQTLMLGSLAVCINEVDLPGQTR